MTIMLEKNLERWSTGYFDAKGWSHAKMGQYGWPDRVVVTPKGAFFVEYKTTTALRPAQKVVIHTLRKLGVTVIVARTRQDIVGGVHDFNGD